MNQVRDADTLRVGIAEGHVRVVTADGTHFGGLWLGRTDDFANERNGFDAFENHCDNGAGHHVGNVIVESLFATASNHLADVFVVGVVMVFGGHDHFHADDF